MMIENCGDVLEGEADQPRVGRVTVYGRAEGSAQDVIQVHRVQHLVWHRVGGQLKKQK